MDGPTGYKNKRSICKYIIDLIAGGYYSTK